jgi:putative 2OG-Fe(II) oxygenase
MSQTIVDQKAKHLETEGFVTFENLFSSELATKAHDEINKWYQEDLQHRKAQNIEIEHWAGPVGHYVLTQPTHLMIDGYTKSPTLDLMFEHFLTSELTQPVIEKLAGKNIKLRGYNIRKMTGAYNPAPAHEWHRDSLGEFGFGILLTDIDPDENAATSFVPGSHLFPYCPRWNNLFYQPRWILSFFYKHNFFNRLLGKKVLKNATGAFGKKGDAYIFINDTWHGRQPNLHGKEGMVVLIGAFPTEYNFPDKVTPTPEKVLKLLPPNLRNVASCQLPPNEPTDTILVRTIRNRSQIGLFTLWRAAQIERKLANIISFSLLLFKKITISLYNHNMRVFRKLRNTAKQIVFQK